MKAEYFDRGRRKRVLFLAECVSLAQVVRLKQLAAALDPVRYEVVFAAAAFDPMVFGDTEFERRTVHSMSAERMYRRVTRGLRLYDHRTLARYVREELSLLEEVRPDLVVSDLRLSLTVSAPKLAIPHAVLINAYWNPAGGRQSIPMPEHPLINLLGVERVAPHFHKGLAFVLEHFAAPVNRLRRAYGLAPVGDLLDVLTHGDLVLYPEVPELTPVGRQAPGHHFIGPVLWAPRVPWPQGWDERDDGRPLVYLTLGSSGRLGVVRTVLEALAGLPVRVLVATAGRFSARGLPANAAAVDYLPGDQAARYADLVICNGGSSTGYQALCEGKPVLGLPFNLDQYLSMDAIARAGAGRLLRSGTARVPEVRAATAALLADGEARRRAEALGIALRRLDASRRFGEVVAAAFA